MSLDRRGFLRSLCFGPSTSPSLVVVFLRGGADGLNLVVPHFDSEYYALRPTLAVRDHLAVDDRFGFSPDLEALVPLFREKRLAVIHAAGSDDTTRSHFEAQDLMERAGHYEEGAAGGWLARHLRSRPGVPGALASVSITPTLPESLRGAPAATAMGRIEDVTLPESSTGFSEGLRVLYASEASRVGETGRSTLMLLDRMKTLRGTPLPKSYPETGFGRALREVARLLKGDVGLEVACIDIGGWDTHYFQGTVFGGRAAELADGLAAFTDDMGDRMDRTHVVVMTEFGRRAYENSTVGTDHGRASIMLALGGRIGGGRVITDWPGLGKNDLEGPGDLRVTIDYRDILYEILGRGLGNDRLGRVFPGFTPTDRGLFV